MFSQLTSCWLSHKEKLSKQLKDTEAKFLVEYFESLLTQSLDKGFT